MEILKENALVVFQGKKIRRIWHKEEWWFSVVDVVEVLTESSIPKRYWSDLTDLIIVIILYHLL